VYAEARPWSSLYASMSVRGGKTIDSANGRQADQSIIEPYAELNLGRHIAMTLSYTRQDLDVAGGRLFTAGLTEARLYYHFNLRTFARAIVQYRDVTREPLLYNFPIDRRSRDLFTQFLFSYKVNPQTVFLVGYSDSSFGDQRVDLTRADRTLFLKIGYAWLL
jgi:hypothetical protein